MRNPQAPHIDFTELQGIVKSNPKLLPSNIDMVLERNGHFLFGEWKRPNEKISEGQKILLKALAKTPKVHVLLIEGDTDKEMVITAIYALQGDIIKKKGESVQDLKDIINRWYLYANQK